MNIQRWVTLSLLLSAVTAAHGQQTVEDWIKVAKQKSIDSDYAGVVEIYDGILTQYPTYFLSLYCDRADAKGRLRDYKGAIADYDVALKLDGADPDKTVLDHAPIYHERGLDKSYLGDKKGALADFDRAQALDPKDLALYEDRGELKMAMSDYDGAIADFAIDIALADEHPMSLYYGQRGIARVCKGDLADAVADLRKAVELERASPGWIPRVNDTHLLLWLVLARLDRRSEADKELSDFMATVKSDPEPDLDSTIGRYLLGQEKEEAVLTHPLALKKNSAWKGYAFYFAGMKRLVDGDKAAALSDLQKSWDEPQHMWNIGDLARAELAVLKKGAKPVRRAPKKS